MVKWEISKCNAVIRGCLYSSKIYPFSLKRIGISTFQNVWTDGPHLIFIDYGCKVDVPFSPHEVNLRCPDMRAVIARKRLSLIYHSLLIKSGIICQSFECLCTTERNIAVLIFSDQIMLHIGMGTGEIVISVRMFIDKRIGSVINDRVCILMFVNCSCYCLFSCGFCINFSPGNLLCIFFTIGIYNLHGFR